MDFIYITVLFNIIILLWIAWSIHRMRKHIESGDYD